jgi:prepilin signal peptidase PulO-like enzyme (type II secretory pathway)
LIGALGLVFGWPDIVLVILLSFVIGSIISVGLMIKGLKSMKDAVPFGPFLVASSVFVFFFGFQFMSLYFGLFGVI